MTFGEMLSILLAKRGMTQSELAEKCGIRKSAITELVKGRSREPTFSRAKRMADALGVTMNDMWMLMQEDVDSHE